MDISVDDQVLAFLGSLSYVLVLCLIFLVRRNQGKTKMTELKYLRQNWLIFVIVFLLGQILSIIKEFMVQIYVSAKGEEQLWHFFYDAEEGISYLLGAFAVGIFDKFFKIGNNYLDKS